MTEESEVEEEIRLILGRLEIFAAKVKDGLQNADFQTRRDIIRTLVKRVEVDEQHIRIVFRVSPIPSPPASDERPPEVDPLLGLFRTFRALAKELVRRVDVKVQSLHDHTYSA